MKQYATRELSYNSIIQSVIWQKTKKADNKSK